MPNSPRTPCRTRGCPSLVTIPGHCNKHNDNKWGRPTVTPPGRYGNAWRKRRKAKLAANPTCTCTMHHPSCCNQTAPATEVHHLIRIRDGGRDEDSNLQALCKQCHAYHTLLERKYA